MKGGAPAGTGATDNCYISRVVAYSDPRCSVNLRLHSDRRVQEAPSGSVPRGPLRRSEKVPSGPQTPEQDTTAFSGAGRQSERRSTDHRSRCGAEQPGPAVGRCGASGDASAIHGQCERQLPLGSEQDPRRHFTVPQPRLGSRGEWLTIRATDKRTLTSPPDHISLKH